MERMSGASPATPLHAKSWGTQSANHFEVAPLARQGRRSQMVRLLAEPTMLHMDTPLTHQQKRRPRSSVLTYSTVLYCILSPLFDICHTSHRPIGAIPLGKGAKKSTERGHRALRLL